MAVLQEEVRAQANLPYHLLLPPDDYETGASNPTLSVSESLKRLPDGELERRTSAAGRFLAPVVPGGLGDSSADRVRLRRADELLGAVNRLLRWYRVAFRQPQIVELTRAQISPVSFIDLSTNENWRGLEPLVFARSANAAVPEILSTVAQIRRGLAGGTDPTVSALNLLDAGYANQTGRFREAVLLCWGAIDATFSTKYSDLAAEALAGEWAEAREYLANFGLPLRIRMSGMMHLVADRSFFRKPGFWEKLSRSYEKRNGIIHRGESATEDDAARAMDVAGEVIAVMDAL